MLTGVPRTELKTSLEDFGGPAASVKQVGEGAAPAQYDWGWDANSMPEGEASFEEMWQQRQTSSQTSTTGSLEPPGGGGGTADFAGGSGIVEEAMRYIGTPYQWGGNTPLGFDCSGFTKYVYAQMGITLPRVSAQQGTGGVGVSREDMQPGDLVFFDWGASGHNMGADHVGIYIGNGQYIHEPEPGSTVHISPLNGDYWVRRYSK